MKVQARKDRMTAREYETSFPETNTPMELIDGEVCMAPTPEGKHQQVSIILSVEFFTRLQKKGTAKVFAAPFDVHLSDVDVLQPDILVIRNERANQIVDQWVRGAPDLVVEIISRTSVKRDRETKPAIYAKAGVPELWLVDIKLQRIEIHQLEEGAYKLASLVEHAGEEAKSVIFPDAVIAWEVVFAE